MTTAWELFFKAKILKDNKGKLTSLYVPQKSKQNKALQRPRFQRNRSKSYMTISLPECLLRLSSSPAVSLSKECHENVIALMELRDNSVHYVNVSLDFSRSVQELGTASLRNFINLCGEWFTDDLDLERFNFYLMPLAFMRDIKESDLIALEESEGDESNFVKYIRKVFNETNNEPSGKYAFSLGIDVKFKKAKTGETLAVQISNDPKAMKVQLSADQIRDKFPYTHTSLCTLLRKRYVDFKLNTLNSQLKEIKRQAKYCYHHSYNLDNPKGSGQWRYASSIVELFDKTFTLRG